MTSYVSFVRDFPMRCRDILDAYEEDAKQKDREVTLLIAVATSAFTIPFERLRPSSSDHVADDRFKTGISKLGRLGGQYFVSWQKGTTWRMLEGLDGGQIRGVQADNWASPKKRSQVPADKKVDSILSIIRNALAHGSIFVYPRMPAGETAAHIEHIIFLSRLSDDSTGKLIDSYRGVMVSPSDFRTFVLDWISFLEGLELPTEIKQELI
jgi:hypothetical protein